MLSPKLLNRMDAFDNTQELIVLYELLRREYEQNDAYHVSPETDVLDFVLCLLENNLPENYFYTGERKPQPVGRGLKR